MSQLIHISIASTTSLPGQVERNLRQIVDFARRAAGDGADLLLTPEMGATGYGNHPAILAAAEVAGKGPIYDALAQAAEETGVVVCAGFVEECGVEKYIAHYAVFPDGRFVVQRKHRVMPNEQPLTVAPLDFQVFEVRGARCALVICADNGVENLNELLNAAGVRVLLLASGAGGRREERVTSKELRTREGREKYFSVLETVFMPGRAPLECIEHRRAQVAVNLCGYDGYRYYHVGHGTITNPMGEVVGFFHGLPNLDRQRPMYAHAEINLDEFVEVAQQ